MGEYTLLLIRLTVYSSVTAGVILLLKKIFQFRIPSFLNSLLWIVLLIRLLIPVMPASKLSVFNYIPGGEELLTDSSLTEEYFGLRPQDDADLYYVNLLLAERSEFISEAGIDVELQDLPRQAASRTYSASEHQIPVRDIICCVIIFAYAVGTVFMLVRLSVAFVNVQRQNHRRSTQTATQIP